MGAMQTRRSTLQSKVSQYKRVHIAQMMLYTFVFLDTTLCLIQKPKRPGNLKSSAARGM